MSDHEAVDHLKVAQVAGYDLVAEMQRGDADLKIRKRNGDTRCPRLGVEPCRQFAHFPRERLDAYGEESLLQIYLPPLSALGSICTPESMAEFNHADRGNYDSVDPTAVLISRRSSLTGCARRSAAISTLESSTNPSQAGPEARDGHQCLFERPLQSPGRVQASSQALLQRHRQWQWPRRWYDPRAAES